MPFLGNYAVNHIRKDRIIQLMTVMTMTVMTMGVFLYPDTRSQKLKVIDVPMTMGVFLYPDTRDKI